MRYKKYWVVSSQSWVKYGQTQTQPLGKVLYFNPIVGFVHI